MKKESGVSPVIATILMIAITVVLAAAIFTLIFSNYISTPYSTAQFIATLSVDPQTSDEYHINLTLTMSSPKSIAFSMARFTIVHNGKYAYLKYSENGVWSNYSTGDSWYYEVKIIDMNKNNKLDSGDQIYVYIVKDKTNAQVPPFKAGDEIILSLEGYNGNAKVTLSF